jgi:Chaperone for protein-folding within the ER, fungal
MALSLQPILLVTLTLIACCAAQLVDSNLVGTWSTKSKKVFTGPGFYNPVTDKLTEPTHPGISYSFTEDGHYEEAYYRAISNRETSILLKSEPSQLTCNSPTTSMPVCNPTVAAWHLHDPT